MLSICFNERTFSENAAWNGYVEVLKYLHEHGCPWNEICCYYASKFGHLHILKYLYDNGCRWDEIACCLIVVEFGHLECLKYLHENGFLEYCCVNNV